MCASESKRTVLVVDDEPDVLRYQAAILEDAGFEVMTASDGDAALERLEERIPDLVSLDLVMPGKSGIKFMHSLRRNRAWTSIPVIIVTGHAHDDQGRSQLRDAEKMASGPQVCLEKPVSPAVYVKAVRERLGIASLEVVGETDRRSDVRREIDERLERAGPAMLERVLAVLRGDATTGAGPDAPSGPSVLVVDDEEDVARTIAVMLEDGGFEATCVTRPRDAVAKAKELAPALITLDVDMPGMSGVEVYAALRAEPDLADVPVIVVTGVEEDARPRFAALPGVPDVDAYLKKPVDPERLLEAAAAARASDRPEIANADDRKTILIVEDEEDVRAFLRGLFQDNDYATMEAASGDEAWMLVREKRPDLVTLDIHMPGETGTRFYGRLIRDEALKSIPVIVISGVAGKHLAVGDPVATFDKPIDRQALLNAVVDAIE